MKYRNKHHLTGEKYIHIKFIFKNYQMKLIDINFKMIKNDKVIAFDLIIL
jgi:hypothetical protein